MKKKGILLLFGAFMLSSNIAAAADAITTANLNFRSGPGTNYALRGSIPAGQLVTIRTCSNNWCQINYGSRTGWASSRYLAFRTSNGAYSSYGGKQSYIPPSLSFNIIVGGGYYDNRYWGRPYYNDYYRPRPPHIHRPPPGMHPHPGIHPPGYGNPGMRPPPRFRLPLGMRPPMGQRPPHWGRHPGARPKFSFGDHHGFGSR